MTSLQQTWNQQGFLFNHFQFLTNRQGQFCRSLSCLFEDTISPLLSHTISMLLDSISPKDCLKYLVFGNSEVLSCNPSSEGWKCWPYTRLSWSLNKVKFSLAYSYCGPCQSFKVMSEPLHLHVHLLPSDWYLICHQLSWQCR